MRAVKRSAMRVLVLLLLVTLTTFPSAANAETAGAMASACRQVADARIVEQSIQFVQTYDTGQCWGAFAMVQQVVSYVDRPGGIRLFGACPPPESTRSQLVALFVEYVNRNPQRMHEDFFEVTTEALRIAFPCGR
jgi:hypothetical protein